MTEKDSIDQKELTGIIYARPQNFAWFSWRRSVPFSGPAQRDG